MYDAERWLEIAEVMSFDTPAIEETKADIEAETAETNSVIEPEAIEAPAQIEAVQIEAVEPRSARVLSIAELRQKLGLELRPPVAAPLPPVDGRPRIVRRREAEALPQMAAG